MVTDIIVISSDGANMEEALEQAGKVAVYKNLSRKNALHLRLLAEEMMGMMRSITGISSGRFWIEDKDGAYKLHLEVDSVMDAEKRKQLLATSSTRKNEASRTLMGRLRNFFFMRADDEIAAYDNPLLAGGVTPAMLPLTDWQWSLTRYQDALSTGVQEKAPEAIDAWDELEKSVVKNVADDVKISITGWQTELIIIKNMT